MIGNNNSNDRSWHGSATFRARREALGLTRTELAVQAGCSLTALSNIEAGVTRRGVTRNKLDDILTALEQEAA